MSVTSTPRVAPEAIQSPASAPRPVAVSELKRAWTAVRAGEFRQPQTRPHRTRSAEPPVANSARAGEAAGIQDLGYRIAAAVDRMATDLSEQHWAPSPGERVIPVVGAAGSVGCSTVAIAVATAAATGSTFTGRSRVVECSSAHASGLAAASTAELGRHESGWVQGMRGSVLLERAGEIMLGLDEVAIPAPLAGAAGSVRPGCWLPEARAESGEAEALTVVDTGWDVGQVVATTTWVGEQTRNAAVVIVVARPTIPGFRRLEAALELLEQRGDHADSRQAARTTPVTFVAVVGCRRKRWAKGVEHSAGPRTRAALRGNRVHEIPEDRHLAVTGLRSAQLPPGLLASADQLLHAALADPGRHRDVDDLPQLTGAPANERATASTTDHLDAEPHDRTGTNPEGTAR